MEQVLRSGLANWLRRRGANHRLWGVGITLLLGSSLIVPSPCTAQTAHTAKKDAQASLKPAAPEPPSPAPVSLPPLQRPASPPVISWDGKRLTIDAENSALSDILLGIRSRTGASIEMPASTNAERVAVHLGPAPIREVLSSLLYGTDFNYVIQASEEDESGLGKVILSSKDGDRGDDVMAGDPQGDPKIRLMPGYAAPGKRDFEVRHSNASDDNPPTVAETPVVAEPVPLNQEQAPAAAATDTASTNPPTDSQPVASTADSADANTSADTTLTAAEQPASANTVPIANASGSGAASSVGGTPTISQMEQNLQKMYQQRQHLQAQQNQGTSAP